MAPPGLQTRRRTARRGGGLMLDVRRALRRAGSALQSAHRSRLVLGNRGAVADARCISDERPRAELAAWRPRGASGAQVEISRDQALDGAPDRAVPAAPAGRAATFRQGARPEQGAARHVARRRFGASSALVAARAGAGGVDGDRDRARSPAVRRRRRGGVRPAPFGSGVGRWTRDRKPAVRARAPRDLSGRRARCAARARISVRLARPAAARSAVPSSRPRVGARAAVRTGRRYGATLSAAPRMPALSRSGRAMSRQPPVAVIDNDCFTWRYAMANDAMIIAVDRIRFLWPRAKKMTLYAVGIAGDNRGKV